MADLTTATAPAAPAAPSTQAPAPAVAPESAQAKTHHSAQQPRAGDGKFTQPPPAPRRIKIADGVELDEEELVADYRGRVVDHEAHARLMKEVSEVRARLEANKDPLKALTRQQREEIAKRELSEFLERQKEAALPPEEREFRAWARAQAEENARHKEDAEKRANTERMVQVQADREYTVSVYRDTMKALGVPDDQDGVVAQQVMAFIYEAKKTGKEYPPETIALRVRRRMHGAASTWVTSGGAKGLLTNPKVVELLNGLKPEEHGQLLEALGPFMETARAYNLQRRGLTAIPGGQARAAPAVVGGVAAPATSLPVGREPRTNEEWLAWFQAGNQPSTPAQYQALQRLRTFDKL